VPSLASRVSTCQYVENAACIEAQDVVRVFVRRDALKLSLALQPGRVDCLEGRVVTGNGVVELLPAVAEDFAKRDRARLRLPVDERQMQVTVFESGQST